MTNCKAPDTLNRHSEPSTRFLAVSYVSVLAVACESLRLWLVGLGGQRAIQLAQTLSYQGLQEGRDYYENLTIFCLESLQDASDLLLAIEPHCLDVEHPSYADTHFFERHQRYHAYMSEPAVQAGLRTLVNNIR